MSVEEFDPERAYALDPQVALRQEPFGALAYHYGNRRLVFLRAPELVDVVEDLANHDSATGAMAAHGIAPSRRRSFVSALASLRSAEVIHAR